MCFPRPPHWPSAGPNIAVTTPVARILEGAMARIATFSASEGAAIEARASHGEHATSFGTRARASEYMSRPAVANALVSLANSRAGSLSVAAEERLILNRLGGPRQRVERLCGETTQAAAIVQSRDLTEFHPIEWDDNEPYGEGIARLRDLPQPAQWKTYRAVKFEGAFNAAATTELIVSPGAREVAREDGSAPRIKNSKDSATPHKFGEHIQRSDLPHPTDFVRRPMATL